MMTTRSEMTRPSETSSELPLFAHAGIEISDGQATPFGLEAAPGAELFDAPFWDEMADIGLAL